MSDYRSVTGTNICFDCDHAVHGCSWSRNFVPPEGSIYEPIYDLRKPGVIVGTHIIACPLFKRTPDRKSVGMISEEENERFKRKHTSGGLRKYSSVK